MAMPLGIAIAVPTPAPARVAMSAAELSASAEPPVQSAKIVTPIRYMRRRLRRSPIRPKIGLPMPIARNGAVIAHANVASLDPRSTATSFSAADKTVLTVPCANCTMRTVAKTIQRWPGRPTARAALDPGPAVVTGLGLTFGEDRARHSERGRRGRHPCVDAQLHDDLADLGAAQAVVEAHPDVDALFFEAADGAEHRDRHHAALGRRDGRALPHRACRL